MDTCGERGSAGTSTRAGEGRYGESATGRHMTWRRSRPGRCGLGQRLVRLEFRADDSVFPDSRGGVPVFMAGTEA